MRKLLAVLCFMLFGTLAASAQSSVAIDLGATYASGGVTFTNLNPQGYNGQPQNNPAVGVFLGAAGTVTVTTLNSGQQYRVIACKSNGTACLLATIAVTGAAQDISATLLAYPIGTGSGSGTITGTMVSTRVPFGVSANVLTTDSDMTFATDTLTVTKIVGSTSITDSGLTSGRVTLASTAGLLADDSDLTFATDTLTATKIIGSTSITDSGLTATRIPFAGTGGLLSDNAHLTFADPILYLTGGMIVDGSAPNVGLLSPTGGHEGTVQFSHGVLGMATADWQLANNDEGNDDFEFTMMERTNNTYKFYAKKGTSGDMYLVPDGGGLGVGAATSTDVPDGTLQADGIIDGALTSTYITQASTAGLLANSVIHDDGTFIYFGTNSSVARVPLFYGTDFYYEGPTGDQVLHCVASTLTCITGSLLATGIVDGTAPVTVTASTPITVGGTYNSGYLFNEHATEATAITYNLPTAAAGKQYCIYNAYETAAETGVLTIATSAAGQYIIFTDGTLSASGGNITSGGAARDAACMVGVDATHWMLVVGSGTWTKH